MTAHAMAGDRERSLEAGMNDHRTKSADQGESIQTWVRNPDHQQQEKQRCQTTIPADSDDLPASIPGVVLEEGLRRVAGNTKVFRKLLLSVRSDFPKRVEDIRAIIAASGPLKDAELHAHSVKGVAGNLGAKDVQAAAEKLETALKTDQADEILERFMAFEEEVHRLSAALKILN